MVIYQLVQNLCGRQAITTHGFFYKGKKSVVRINCFFKVNFSYAILVLVIIGRGQTSIFIAIKHQLWGEYITITVIEEFDPGRTQEETSHCLRLWVCFSSLRFLAPGLKCFWLCISLTCLEHYKRSARKGLCCWKNRKK